MYTKVSTLISRARNLSERDTQLGPAGTYSDISKGGS